MLRGIIAALWEKKVTPDGILPSTVFFLDGGLKELSRRVDLFKNSGKTVFVDIDFVSGLQGDRDGIDYLKSIGVDGIITARMRTYNVSTSAGLPTLLRFFALDSRAVDKGLQQVSQNNVRAIEILPAMAAAKIASRIRGFVPNINIVAAGLVSNLEEIEELKKHVDAVSTSSERLWNAMW
ncbi:MAG TPA: glycerol-3-phosphate responsive antiterminator GlpP [Kosmotogaceae bacterium]|nr:MAG: Glycerol-3-phosphate responsive antiterminator, GlpP [Thermotogales bacterium 46_20]HAA85436.1 glycerol-3-phosphate responsive antiterminator GlpP [Kosmotogaceae bacterium]